MEPLLKTLCAIPCFNEELAIGSVVALARQHADEVLVIDDGSSDRTAEIAQVAGATVIVHEKNGGKGKAYGTLWAYARDNDVARLVVLDGDGQHDAAEIPLLLKPLEQGADLVVGVRWGDQTEMPTWRKAGKRVLDYATAAASGAPVTDSQSGYRSYSRKAIAKMNPSAGGFSVESQLLVEASKAKLNIAEARIHCRYDGLEGSTKGPVRHAAGVLNDLLIFLGLKHPLLLIGLPGLLLTLGAIALGAYSVWLYQTEGLVLMGYLLVTILSGIIGVMAVFMGMVFHLLPRAVR